MADANLFYLAKSIAIWFGYSVLVWYVFFCKRIVIDSKSRHIFVAIFVILLLRMLLSVAIEQRLYDMSDTVKAIEKYIYVIMIEV
jgi:hypothetical protein